MFDGYKTLIIIFIYIPSYKHMYAFRDANTTTMFVVGSTFGEAIVPVIIGTKLIVYLISCLYS